MLRRLLAALCLGGALLVPAAPAGAQAPVPAPDPAAPEWKQWPLPVPPGGRFQTPGGIPGDLSFFRVDRGLMTVGGNNSVPEGLWSWDGVRWHQLATVCGGGASARIAWAGPDEFWTITRPSRPRPANPGIALCHFKGGEVVGSYSTVERSEGAYQPMAAAACNGPNDCWFAGKAGFHLHWNGSSVRAVQGPQGRGVSDLLADGNRLFESAYVGADAGALASSAILREPENPPRLLHRIEGGAFSNDMFVPRAIAGTSANGSELLALDSDGQSRWAVGGGATLETATAARPPLAARLDADDVWRELTLTDALPTNETFGDVAAIPGSGGAAWVTLTRLGLRGPGSDGGALQQPKIAHISPGGAVRIVQLAGGQEPTRGAATRVDCPAANDCWVATARGFLYRLAAAPTYEADTDPAFQGTITVRPNEAAEQAIPDDPPQDDSLLLAPPVEAASERSEAQADAETCNLPKLISRQRSKVRGKRRLKLVISFRLARRARVGLTARRGGNVVARAKPRMLQPGNRSLTLRVTRRRYPKQLSFVISDDSGQAACATTTVGGTTDR